jgi:hypothetical protein
MAPPAMMLTLWSFLRFPELALRACTWSVLPREGEAPCSAPIPGRRVQLYRAGTGGVEPAIWTGLEPVCLTAG